MGELRLPHLLLVWTEPLNPERVMVKRPASPMMHGIEMVLALTLCALLARAVVLL